MNNINKYICWITGLTLICAGSTLALGLTGLDPYIHVGARFFASAILIGGVVAIGCAKYEELV